MSGPIGANHQQVAENLKKLRGNKPVSEVASATGIGVSALLNYEAGLRMPRYEAMAALAYYYGKSVDDIFFTGKDTKRGVKAAN